MKTKLPLKIMLFLCLSLQAQAQTLVKASAIVSNSASGITNVNNAADSDAAYLNTYAQITSVGNLLNPGNLTNNNRFIEIGFPEDVPANTPVYLRLTSDPDNNILGVLAGGAIGNLLTGVLNTALIGNQTITVEGITNGGTSLFTNSSFNTESFRVVYNAAGETFIKITHNAAYRRLKITNHAIAGTLDNNKTLNIYGAYFVKVAASCASAAYTSYTAGGLLSVVDVSVTNPGKAIDANNSTYSSLSLGVLGVGEWVSQTVYFEGSAASTDSYNVKVSIPSALLAANLINGITVSAYSGTNTTAVYTSNLSSLLGLPVNAQVLGLLQNNQPGIISVAPGVAVDRITLRYEALASVNTNYNILLYEITKGFNLSVTGAGSFFTNANVTLSANVTPVQCSATYTYSWTATGSSTVLGTSQTYAPPTATPGTYNYTVTVTDSNGVVKTAAAQVIILAPPVAGSVNNVLLECTETSPVNLTLTGYTGGVARWEKADNPGFTGATTIATTSAFLTPAQMGTITSETYFRAVVTQNGYPEVYSTGGAVTVKSSTWNGTAWSNGTPDIGTIIYFTGNYNENTDLTGCKIYVNNGAVVSIPTNNTVHLNKSINVVSGSFTLQNEAHLLQDTATEPNTGNVTVTRNGSNLYRLDYTIWSAPVTGQNLLAFSPATSTNPSRFYEYAYVAANDAELYVGVDAANTNFGVGKGYLIRMPNSLPTVPGYNAGTATVSHIGLFTGVPNNGTITRALSTEGNRYTAIGNPYPSPINVHDFFTTNSEVLETGAALYFWRKKNNYYASSYATITWDVYTYNHAVGGNPGEDQYGGQQWDDNFNTTDPNNWTINTGQGFLVKTKETLAEGVLPNITFNAAMRRGSVHTNQFFRTLETNEDLTSRIWLELQSPTYTTQAALVYSNTATLGLDYGRDAALLADPGESFIWSKLDDYRLAIQARPQFSNTDVVPLGFNLTASGNYTLALHRADGIFAQGQDIYLKDNLLGTITNLSEGAYTFNSGAGSFETRFEVVYQTEGALGNSLHELENEVMVYQNNGAIYITTGTIEMTGVTLYDVSGRKLYAQTGINSTETKITNLAAAQQVLLVEINTPTGAVSKKIVY